MEDKILQAKKEMERIIKIKSLTRLERYDLTTEKTKLLDEKSMSILLEECKRDYESCQSSKEVKDYITIFLTGIGLLFTLLGIFLKDKVMEISQFGSLMIFVAAYVIFSVVILSWIHHYKSSRMNISKYMFDILDKQYKERFTNHQ